MSSKKEQDRGNTRRERDTLGQQRVTVIKPTNPDEEKGQRRVVRRKKQGKK